MSGFDCPNFPPNRRIVFFPGAASGRDDTTRRFLFTDMASGGRHRLFGVISPSGSPDRDDQTKLNKSDLQSRPPFSSFILIFFFFFIRLNSPHRFRRHRATKFTEEQRLKQKELLEVSAPPVSKARFTFSLFHTRTVPFWRGDDDNRFIFIICMISVIMYTAAFLPSRARGTKRLTRFMRYCLVASFPPDRVFTHRFAGGWAGEVRHRGQGD